jgi:fibronectin type 3 domain-containing protein
VAAATVPGAPTNRVATRAARQGIALTWNAPASNGGAAITSYTVYRGGSSGGEQQYATVSCTSSSCAYTDAGTSKNATYYYQVAAVNSVGTGPRSNESSARSG